ncbi:NAD-dependent epimerase/dehydratase family protein [Thermodesulfobacteriota bacterium]
MITILGATGFIGSSLHSRLLKEGRDCTGLSRPSFNLKKPSTYTVIPEDTRILIHSAGPAGPEYLGEAIWRESVQATYDLLEFLREERHIERLLYISSGTVYKPSISILTEKSPLAPSNIYGMSRLLSEKMIETKFDNQALSIRVFFPFGPHQKSPRLIPELIDKIKKGEIVSINNESGSPKINPIYIDDLVDQITNFLEGPIPPVINLGGSESVTIRELAEMIGKIIGKEPRFEVLSKDVSNFYCKSFRKNSLTIDSRLKAFLNKGNKHA